MSDSEHATQTLVIEVDRIKYTQEKCSIFGAHEDGGLFRDAMAVKMWTGPVRQGQRWTVVGGWKEDEKWGRQFVATFGALATPRSFDELAAFLTSGLVEGWGWSEVMRMREALGDDACRVIDEQPHRLQAEAGITEMQYETLMDAWEKSKGLAPIYAKLADWGIGERLAERLIKAYRYAVLETIEENPYKPIQDVSYYTWRVAEEVTAHLGIAGDDPRRIEAGVAEVIRQGATEEGHTWMTYNDAMGDAMWLLDVDAARMEAILQASLVPIEQAGQDAAIVQSADKMYPGRLWWAEQFIAGDLAGRLQRSSRIPVESLVALQRPDHLDHEQWLAVQMALTNTVSLLTGGPGTGKTTTLREVVAVAKAVGMPVTLMAPTGKAAQRMQLATGHAASTIHRKLKLIPGQLQVGDDVELLTGMVIVDEVSMLDTATAAALLSGISINAHILLVGDPDQLLSVGPGAVLRDLLAANLLRRVHLCRVFRNDQGVALNAAHIRAGEPIQSLPDCRILPTQEPAEARELVMSLLVGELRQAGYSADDVLVLTPKNDGESGRHTLNTQLQALFNAAQAGQGMMLQIKGDEGSLSYELRPGDRVIVVKNNSELGVFNGDTGHVVSVLLPKTIIAEIDGREVQFTGADQKLLQLAYAITVHKSQGSEAPVVVAPIFSSRVLSRELLYTCITRARKQVYLIGDVGAIQGSIGTVRIDERRTGLVQALAQTTGRSALVPQPV